jgi:uncharacterized phage protein (TIGR02218 family)
MAHKIKPVMASLMVSGVQCFAALWKIERVDGTIFRFTDHNVEIEFEGEIYSPSESSFSATAREFSDGTTPQNFTASGAIVSSSITDEDLREGLFDMAKVVETIVDWRFPWAGHFISRTFLIEETKTDGVKWEAKVAGLLLRLSNSIGSVYSKDCEYRLGDSRCGVDLTSFTETGRSVVAVTDDHLSFTSDATGADGRYDFGVLTWTSGLNTGLSREVKTYLNSGGAIELQVETGKEIQIGDQFTIVAGCDNTIATCSAKFSNHLRFGGYPFIPGNDQMLQTPNSKTSEDE